MSRPYGPSNLAIYAYGSLLSDPGEKIAQHIIARIPYLSPWPIEYARRAKLRGNGPTLVLHKTGGIVQGQLLVLDVQQESLDELREWLWDREGKPPRALLKQMSCGDFGCVLDCRIYLEQPGAARDGSLLTLISDIFSLAPCFLTPWGPCRSRDHRGRPGSEASAPLS